MKNTKLMLIAVGAVFAIAAGATACDEAVTCETDEDCDSEGGEVCDVAEGSCQTACASDADCPDELCCPDGDVPDCKAECTPVGEGGSGGGTGGHGGGGVDCGAGFGLGVDGACHQECTGVADCYDIMGYCASDALCYDVADFATCTRVAGMSMDISGPLIFDPGQDTIGDGTLCTKDPANCPNSGDVCQFSFQFYDPDSDVATTHGGLYTKVRFVDSGGTLIDTFDVVPASGTTIAFMGCFDEALTSISAGVVLLDNASNKSNPLCFEGSTP